MSKNSKASVVSKEFYRLAAKFYEHQRLIKLVIKKHVPKIAFALFKNFDGIKIHKSFQDMDFCGDRRVNATLVVLSWII